MARIAESLIVLSVKSVVKLVLWVGLIAVLAAPALRAQREKLPPDDLDFVEKTWPQAKKTSTGIRYVIVKPGHDARPVAGDKVQVLYVGRLLNGTEFDSALDPEHPFAFRVSRGMVIDGWDQILPQMQRGEKRIVIIPPELAYGTRGQPPKIPRNATLVFEMELLDFQHE